MSRGGDAHAGCHAPRAHLRRVLLLRYSWSELFFNNVLMACDRHCGGKWSCHFCSRICGRSWCSFLWILIRIYRIILRFEPGKIGAVLLFCFNYDHASHGKMSFPAHLIATDLINKVRVTRSHL